VIALPAASKRDALLADRDQFSWVETRNFAHIAATAAAAAVAVTVAAAAYDIYNGRLSVIRG